MERLTARFKAMGSPCEIILYGADQHPLAKVAQICVDRTLALERKYSRYLPDSVVSQINSQAGIQPVAIDQETFLILGYAKACFEQSDGLFDITSGVLRKLWHRSTVTLPSPDCVQRCLEKVGFDKLEFDEDSAFLSQPGMEIDLGGVVKEYASDVVANFAKGQRAISAVACGVVNLGGDLSCFGPSPDSDHWHIGIAHPHDSTRAITKIQLAAGAISTSGSYERWIEINGCKYSHLLDPTSGWPVAGLLSATVIADQAIVAGSLSSIALLKPARESLTWLTSLGVDFIAIDADLHQYGPLADKAPCVAMTS